MISEQQNCKNITEFDLIINDCLSIDLKKAFH